MCRMCLATFTNADIPKLDLVHELMLRTCHDEGGQRDGWGINGGDETWTSSRWYYEEVPMWKPSLPADGFVMSHLRKASGGTGRTRTENHPYEFEIGDQGLVAMHNGFFSGGVHPAYQQNVPNTDSYRAFVRLTGMMNADADITADMMNEWLSEYKDDSHYAVMLKWRGYVYALRGKSRNLAALQVGNGYIVNTSIQALIFAKEYLRRVCNVEVEAEPYAIPDNTMLRFALGSADVEVSALDPKHQPVYVQQVTWPNTPPKSEPLSTIRSAGGSESADIERNVVIAPAVTKPRHAKQVSVSEGTMTLKERRFEWSKLANRLSPLRSDLSAYWCASILGYVDVQERPSPVVMLSSVSTKELDILTHTLTPNLIDNPNRYMKPFSPVGMYMINWWNHHVIYGADAKAHELLFTQGMFFLDDNYTQLKNKPGEESDPQFAMSIWIPYMLRLISYIPSRARDTLFHKHKLEETANIYSTDRNPISFSTEMILRGDRP